MSIKEMALLNINHGHNDMNILHVKNFWKFNKWESFVEIEGMGWWIQFGELGYLYQVELQQVKC
jgi:hypothetical protein